MISRGDFEARLRGSAPAVFYVALMQHLQGRDVEVRGIRIAASYAEHEAYRDVGDLFSHIEGEWRRIEVKHLQRDNFTSLRDWPYHEVLVGTVESVDRPGAEGVLHGYTIVSADFRAVIHIRGDRKGWRKVSRRNRVTGIRADYYAVANHLVQFQALPEAFGEPFRLLRIVMRPADAADCARIVARVGELLEGQK